MITAGLFHAEIAEVRRDRREAFLALRAGGRRLSANGRVFEAGGFILIFFSARSAYLGDLCVR
jgi:hypothetical protein